MQREMICLTETVKNAERFLLSLVNEGIILSDPFKHVVSYIKWSNHKSIYDCSYIIVSKIRENCNNHLPTAEYDF